jgi:hypothetical protein
MPGHRKRSPSTGQSDQSALWNVTAPQPLQAVSVLNVDHRHAQLPGRPAVVLSQHELFASAVQQTLAVP